MTAAALTVPIRQIPFELAPPPVAHVRWHSLDGDAPPEGAIQDVLPLPRPGTPAGVVPGLYDTTFDRQPTPTEALPDAAAFVARLGIVLVEIAAGSRHATQVMRHCTPRVFESLLRRQSHRLGRAGSGTRPPVRLRRTRVCHVRDGVVEATVIVADSNRVRPIALRLEGLDGRWLVTALEMG